MANTEQSHGMRWWRHAAPVAVLLLCMVLLRAFAVQPQLIVSDSMVPTLAVGDRLVMDKLSYRFHPPCVGDIVVFKPPPALLRSVRIPPAHSIKRVIAVSGQEVQVRDGQVLVDGQPLREPYISDSPTYTWGPARVPEDMLFVLGDNRNASADSHVWGFLPRTYVSGKAWLRFWPVDRLGTL
ncbi:signal peptidase I [Archangium minus]|uniref:Signal peptidase I n=1 Tax=Archangium minus TaxID=83450 RepID=A0ABY9WGP6_9BACT|nr:signal peptidase I [Archangium minus]